jgi:WD40 repeat protein
MIIRVWDERRVANRERSWPTEVDDAHTPIELVGHEDSITALVFDGSTLFSGDDAGKILVWDTELHVQMRELVPPNTSAPPAIRQLLVVPAPGMLCSVVTDGSLVLWDIVQGKVRKVVRQSSGESFKCVEYRQCAETEESEARPQLLLGTDEGQVVVYPLSLELRVPLEEPEPEPEPEPELEPEAPIVSLQDLLGRDDPPLDKCAATVTTFFSGKPADGKFSRVRMLT